MKKIIGMIVLAGLLFSSCDFITTSFGKTLVRDRAEVFKDASASELAKYAGEVSASNSDTAKAVMDALASVSAEDLAKLTKEEQENILKLAVDATVPMSAVTDLLDTAFSGGAMDETAIADALASITEFDATALNALLGDHDGDVDPSVLATAALASVVQSAGVEGMKNIKDTVADGGDIKDALDAITIPPATQYVIDSLTARADAGEIKLFGMLPIGDLF